MTMSKGDAVYLNRLCQWMAGDPTVPTDEAYELAARLADRAHAVLGAGVSGATVRESYTRDGADPLPDLLAAMWAVEASDGSWSGGDAVQLLTQRFDAAGLTIRHPARWRETTASRRIDWTPDELRHAARTQARTRTRTGDE